MGPNKIRAIVEKTSMSISDGYIIVRAQTRREINIKLSNGRVENVSTGSESGIGVQAFTMKGASGFASVNGLDDLQAEKISIKALELAKQNERIGCELNKQIFYAPRNRDEISKKTVFEFDHFTPEELQELVNRFHARLREIKPEKGTISWQTSFRQIEDFWCIGRTDGTLVSFFIPRAVLLHQGTVKEGEQGQSFSLHRSGVDVGILLAEKEDLRLHQKAMDKARFVQEVLAAPTISFGSFSLVIDYGLAKGLAHESFGHAVESDLLEESVLGINGKLRKGLVVADQGVNIIDGSVEGDWAYQPYSANGLVRETVGIVKNGILEQGLGDIFSAAKAGMEMTGAGRAEYFGSVPLPRMTNIRLTTAKNIPLPESSRLFEEITAIRATLEKSGLLEVNEHYLLLGYRGGQVNIKTGDFVFQCDGAVNLADPCLKVYKPGIFSGKILSVMESVKLSLGEERYDAIGTCGKSGQLVPSSGGGSGYILLRNNDNVKLGGKEVER